MLAQLDSQSYCSDAARLSSTTQELRALRNPLDAPAPFSLCAFFHYVLLATGPVQKHAN